MGTKDFSWPKALSDGPELINQSGGLVKAHPVEIVSPLKGTLVNPVPVFESYDGQITWVQGESLRGRSRLVSRSSVSTAAPASATEAFVSSVTTVALASAMEGSSFGFSGVEESNRRLKEETQTLIAGILKVGLTAKLMGPGYVVSFDLRHQRATP